jgi:hypothetical protein
MPTTLAITTPSTAAIVTLVNPRFENAAGEEDPEFISMDMQMKFNGVIGELGDKVTFPRNATLTVKNTTIRNRVNEVLAPFEPGVVLTNANIQLVGLPT